MDAEEEAAWLREQEEEEDASEPSEEEESAGEDEEGEAALQLSGDGTAGSSRNRRRAGTGEIKFPSLISVFILDLMSICVGYCSLIAYYL